MAKTVLIVDDNAIIRQALCELFKRETDFEVCGEAENGREAVEKAQQLQRALNWRLLLKSPVDGLKLPRQSRHEMQALTVEQVRMFLKVALATPHGPVLAVAVATGMRPE